MEVFNNFIIFLVFFILISGTSSAVEELSHADRAKENKNMSKPSEQNKLNLEDNTGPTVSREKRHFGYGYGYDPYYYGYYPRPLPVPVLVGGGLLVGGYRGFGYGGFGGRGFGFRGFGGRGFGARGFGGRGFGGGFGRGRG